MNLVSALRRLRSAYAPAIAAPVLGLVSLVLVEGSDGGNSLGVLSADAFAFATVALAVLTLLMSGARRLRPEASPVFQIGEWLAVFALVLAALVHANAIEGSGGAGGWTNYVAQASDG